MSQEQLEQKNVSNCNSKMKVALISMGANLSSVAGPPQSTLTSAIAMLQGQGVVIRAVSRFFETPCFPAGAGPDYVNAALSCVWGGAAEDLMTKLHDIEASFARKRVQRWGMRTLDLDLLALGDEVSPDVATYRHWRDLPLADQKKMAPEQLILPHPRLQDRGFVLVPLMDIASGWVHPVSGQDVATMMGALPPAECAGVKSL